MARQVFWAVHNYEVIPCHLIAKKDRDGRRLEREDNNKALAEMYGYEGGTESPLVKITFTIPKEHFKRLMPIKQGDVFGIENLTNKEGIR